MYFRFLLYLLCVLTATVLVAGALAYKTMTANVQASAANDLSKVLQEVNEQYEEAALKVKMLTDMNNRSMLARTRSVTEIIKLQPDILDSKEELQKLCNENLAESIIVSDENGNVRVSTPDLIDDDVLGIDYEELLACATGDTYEQTTLMDTGGQLTRFASVRRKDAPGVVILSFYLEHEQSARENCSLANLITDMAVGDNGYIIAFSDGVQVNQSVLPTSEAELRSLPINSLVEKKLQDDNYFLYATFKNGLRLIGVVPADEYYATRTKGVKLQLFTVAALSITMLGTLMLLLKRFVLRDIVQLNKAIRQIADGNFDTKVKESATPEFQKLTMNINTMLDSLRSHDDKISEWNQREAGLARSIKESILPNPARLFAERKDFNMVATVVQAKTVGGDFYDCRLIDNDHLGFVLSSVNAQGVPAALHMMYWLAVLRSFSNQGLQPAEIAQNINSSIFSGAGAGVQVSLFIGHMEISTGRVVCVNAGLHTPLLQRQGEEFAEVGLPVANACGVSPDTVYKESVFEMQPGDRLFLCTNALTCMVNEQKDFFGEARLRTTLRETAPTLRDIPHLVRTALRRFIGNQKREEDCSMICLELPGQNRHGASVSVSARDTDAAAGMIRSTLEEVFAAPNDIDLIIRATETVMSAIPGAPTVRIVLGCTERHARITLTYSGPKSDILAQLPQLHLDSTSYHHLDNVNDIILYKEIE